MRLHEDKYLAKNTIKCNIILTLHSECGFYQTIPASRAEETVRALSMSLVNTPAARP